MSTRSQLADKLTSTRGGTVIKVLLIILGVFQAIIGTILMIASIAMLAEGDRDMFILLPFALLTLVGGIVIIVAQAKAGSQDAEAPAYGGERVVSSQPLGSSASQAQDVSASQANPAESEVSQDPTQDIAHLVFRSNDLFATLRDLVRHESQAGSQKLHLAEMLAAAGVMGWPDAPACEGGRLSRNTHFWIRLSTDDLTETQYDTMVTAEAALGVNQDLPQVRAYGIDDPQTSSAALDLLRTMADQTIEPAELTSEGLRVAYQSDDADASTGEWIIRSVVCNAAECVRTPFRVVFDLRANVPEGLVALSLEIPRPHCMALFSSDSNTQVALARAYALRLAVLLARHAFDASDKVKRVVINGHEHGSDDTLLSLDLDRTLLDKLRAVVGTARIEQGFPSSENIRASLDTGWFAPVTPFVSIDDPLCAREEAHVMPELDLREASPAIQRTCHAERICDLGINENAVRIAAWHEVRPTLGTTTEQAVSALVAARDKAADITVVEACTRCVQALVNGEVDLDDLSKLADLFVDGSTLDRAVARAVALLDEDGHEEPEKAAQILEAALAPIDDMGVYLDDDTYVYRYFGSVSERVHHNGAVDEGGREIRLVPDSYFNAHSNASIALGMIGETARAMAHADVCLRLAPTSTYATMRKVRLLESESRIYEAADLILEALRHAVTPRDAAICHYRLAYMEWKLGREDLAVACYQRSMNWDTEMRSQAHEELDDLLSSNNNLERLTDEQADALLAREGIPLGCVRTDGEHTLAAAVACMDDGAFLSARPLVAALYGMNNDDVVMGVYRSLNVGL